jgi:hypothetical protein
MPPGRVDFMTAAKVIWEWFRKCWKCWPPPN